MDTKDLAPYEAKGQEYLAEVKAMEIKSDTDYNIAIAYERSLKTFQKEVIDLFKAEKRDKRAEWQAVVDQEKKYLAPTSEAIAVLRGLTTRWHQKVEAGRRAEAQRRITAAESAGLDPALVQKPEEQKTKGVSYRTAWDFEVVDFASLPDEYKTADEKKIRAVVQAAKGNITIPGVKITEKQIQAVRT